MSPTTKLSWATQSLRVIPAVQFSSNDYVIRVLASPLEVNAEDWNALLALQPHPLHAPRIPGRPARKRQRYTAATGWTPRFITLWRGSWFAACPLYLKDHSYGEYVFDWAWANAYEQHGLAYYPKALVAVPFTPVPGARLLARDAGARQALRAGACRSWCSARAVVLHLLFAADEDIAACERRA
jgi:predicted N-acyltransferase